MNCRLSDLRSKEVISSADGARLGTIDDVIVDTCSAKISAVVIFNRSFPFWMFKRGDDYVIPWEKIELIGEDAVIVSCKMQGPRKSPGKRLFFWKN